MRDMFTTIAPKYDFITRAFSFGMDRGWKRLAVTRAGLPSNARVLDLACGTGDFGKLALAHCSGAQIVASDLTEPMLRLAQIPDSACADAASLPFQSACFDAVFIGYGLRNFPRLEVTLQEVHRVLKPGGVLVSLDFFLPRNGWLRRLYLGYLYAQGAAWGILLHGRARVYTYIPDSLRNFLTAETFSSLLEKMQFTRVTARKFLLGGIAVHWARKL
ncbi:MAG TPA: ubiquinone/menaquinone biosynthesis methyltransferase [Bryobacteraceae bacterium]|nr:ubiquinone/menaquinone biosynthesis methyltransferase [Bryobacteraceae bacterium]